MNVTSNNVQRLLHSLKDFRQEKNKHAELRRISSEMLLLISQGKNVLPFLSRIVQMLPSNDLLIKRFCNVFIKRYTSTVPELRYLIANTLQKDCTDPNPLIRSLSLQLFCSIPTFVEYSDNLISQGLQDSSGHVRRTAGLCCTRVSIASQSLPFDKGYIDDLYAMLRDSDPIVVTNCLNSLEEILQNEGGVVINKNIAHYLLKSLPKFTEWNLVHIFHYLCKYSTADQEEIADMLGHVEPFYLHPNVSVCVSVLQYFLHLQPNLEVDNEPLLKMQLHLTSLMFAADTEILFVVLDLVDHLTAKVPRIFSGFYTKFFCHYGDMLHIKLKKIDILAKFVNDDNISDILKELQSYSSDVTMQVSTKAVETIGIIASLNDKYLPVCTENLLFLLEYQYEPVCSQVLGALMSLDIPIMLRQLLYKNLKTCNTSSMNSRGRSAFLWLLGEYCYAFEETFSLLETMLKYWEEENLSRNFQHNLLLTAVKLFLHQPAEGQFILGQILELCFKHSDLTLKDRTSFYLYLLKNDIAYLKTILSSVKNSDSL